MFNRLPLIILSVSLLCISCTRSTGLQKLVAGGFTEGNGKGLFFFEFNRKGNLELISEADAGPNPSYFCFSERHDLIYALNEVPEFKGSKGGGITTLYYDPATGNVEKKGEIVVPYGGPCHIALSSDSTFLFIASYGSGSIAVVSLNADGIPERVTDTILYGKEALNVSHPHMISNDPAGKHVYLTDLGLDRIVIFDFDKEKGKLIPVENGIIKAPGGSGPRHFIFNRDGSKLYLINEKSSTIIVFHVTTAGILVPVQTLSTLRSSFTKKNSCAAIFIGKNNDFLYASNRGENSIAVFKIENNGLLKLAGHSSCGGDWPRSFVLDPSGKFLLSGNQRSNTISVFKINQETGIPEGPIGKAAMKAPAFLEFWNKKVN